MKKILIIILFLLASCASRKVDVSKSTLETKTDSSVVVKIDGTYVKDNNVFTEETVYDVEYKPLDSLKPMIINGKSYINTVIKSKKKRFVKVDKTKVIAKVSSIKKVSVKKQLTKKSFTKKIDKKANYWAYLWLLISIVIVYVLYRYRSYIFPFIKFFK